MSKLKDELVGAYNKSVNKRDAFLQNFKSNTFVGTFADNGANDLRLSKTELRYAISNSVPFPEGPKEEQINDSV